MSGKQEFCERFTEISANSHSANDLMEVAENGGVVLNLQVDAVNKTCAVCSYACNDRGELYVYLPSHTLIDRVTDEPVKAATAEEWRARYRADDTYISIADEFYCRVEYEPDYVQFAVLLNAVSESTADWYTELYIHKDNADFCGPLEIDFLRFWLDAHPEYACETLTTE